MVLPSMAAATGAALLRAASLIDALQVKVSD
jgi:hypothetical protein